MMRTRFRYVVVVLVIALPRVVAAQAQDEVFYYHLDAIGSVRAITDANGQVVELRDFLPFGEPWPPNGTNSDPRQFTGQEHDVTTGLDYFGARYYASLNGRFTRADDHGFSDPGQPQTLALYVYVQNNPLRYNDPTGHCPPSVNFCIGVIANDDAAWIFESLTRLLPPKDDWSLFGWNANAWGAAAQTMFSREPQIDAWNRGYYKCLANKNVPGFSAAATAHAAGDVAVETADHFAPKLAGAYYHFTDARFTAWGKYSKVMVPKAAAGIRLWGERLSAAGLAYADYELVRSIGECSEVLH